MALGRRCSAGCASWPDLVLYATCPLCGESTTRFSGLSVLDTDEALKMKRHAEFEHYYERYCSDRNQPVDGPLEEPKALPSDAA